MGQQQYKPQRGTKYEMFVHNADHHTPDLELRH